MRHFDKKDISLGAAIGGFSPVRLAAFDGFYWGCLL
jgi:hypothetical protein